MLPHERGSMRGPDNEDRAELLRREPTVKEILKRLDPELADININGLGGTKRPATPLTVVSASSLNATSGKRSSLPTPRSCRPTSSTPGFGMPPGPYGIPATSALPSKLPLRRLTPTRRPSSAVETSPITTSCRKPSAPTPPPAREAAPALPRCARRPDRPKPPAWRAPVRSRLLRRYPQPCHSRARRMGPAGST